MIEVSKMLAHTRVAATTNITLSGLQTIDTIVLKAGDRVLVARQTAGAQNGVYVAAAGAWARAADFDVAAEMPQYTMVPVYEGAEHGRTSWLLLTPATIVVGTTVIYFAEMVGHVDPESGATIPDGASAPFPDPIEEAMDYAEEARGHVIAQYRDSPRMVGIVEDLVGNAQAMEEQLVLIPPMDDPAVAEGVNLDVTGDLVGQSRVLKTGTELNDAAYRLLIAQRILRNKSIGSAPEFVDALTAVLDPTPFRFVDLGHMSVIVEIATGAPPTDDQIALLDYGPTPRAMAVGVGRRWYDGDNYFGFAEDPDAEGFGENGDPPPPGGKFAEHF